MFDIFANFCIGNILKFISDYNYFFYHTNIFKLNFSKFQSWINNLLYYCIYDFNFNSIFGNNI